MLSGLSNNKQISRQIPEISDIKNLVFQGGSVKGIAYVGAYEEALKAGLEMDLIENVAGTSAGAITALLLALGYSVEEMYEILSELKFTSFLDEKSGKLKDALLEGKEKKSVFSKLAFMGSRATDGTSSAASERLEHHFGLFDGEVFRLWAEKCIKRKTRSEQFEEGIEHLTFKELHKLRLKNPNKFKDLYVVGEDVSTGMAKTFSHLETPNVVISDAVRISMSIPLIFSPHKKYVKDGEMRLCRSKAQKKLYVDGGMLENYPLRIFDKKENLPQGVLTGDKKDHIDGQYANPTTLGFRLADKARKDYFEGKTKAPVLEINNFVDYLKALVSAVYKKQESDHVRTEEQSRTIYIDTCGVGMLDFNLSKEKEELLIESGKEAVKNYFHVKIENNELTINSSEIVTGLNLRA